MNTAAPRILVADDQPDVLAALVLLLKSASFEAQTASSPGEVMKALEGGDFDALLMDLNYNKDTTSGREGFDLLTRIQNLDSTFPVIVMTAYGSVDGAVEAMKRGARDYIQKPWENNRVLTVLSTQVTLGRALRRSQRLEDENRLLRRDEIPKVVADSRGMKRVRELIDRVAPSEANILITGDHGTGKEVVARRLHVRSSRASGPFVPVNAGAISESLLESELFGHVKGAFTDARDDRLGCFELAHTGTLFLDEIANMPVSGQSKLLRVLETGEVQRVGSSKLRRVDVRIIAATNANLAREMKEGRFREDLLYRLNTVEIHLPPLRERREDIVPLANLFLREFAARMRKPDLKLAPDVNGVLEQNPWPGNVRELRHTMERAVILSQGETVGIDDLGLAAGAGRGARLEDMTLDQVEQYVIEKALERNQGNALKAADALGLSRSAFYRRTERFGISGTGAAPAPQKEG